MGRSTTPRRDKRAGDKCGFAAFAVKFAPTVLASAANSMALLHSLPAKRERLGRQFDSPDAYAAWRGTPTYPGGRRTSTSQPARKQRPPSGVMGPSHFRFVKAS